MTGHTVHSTSTFSRYAVWFSLCIGLTLIGCSPSPNKDQGKEASDTTSSLNDAALKIPAFALDATADDASKGLIARLDSIQVVGTSGSNIWDTQPYDFIQGDAPNTVHPSLWRQAKLNNLHGLFKVTDRVYQLRGFDLANMTIIEGDTQRIIVDPLTTAETAKAALEFAERHLGKKAIHSVLYTHSHIDHFGGVAGVVEGQQHDVNIIAPAGFMHEATSENIIAGTAMGRRSIYMYGKSLPKGPKGHIDSGLGKEPALGTFTLLPPTKTISRTGETLNLDGVEFIFQMANGSEAPAEFTFYLPQFKVFCGAEMVSQTLHNLYTLRGAKVRDSLKWSDYIQEAITLFDEAEIYLGSHHWPVWGKDNVAMFLKQQRDTYKFIHDQSVRWLNQGLTPSEIAERIEMPASLRTSFSNQGYYGTLKHNAKAVYQFYMGWYDGNPANLNPLPASETAERYIELMGGEDNVIEAAQKAYEEGDYRWASELLNHLVFANPDLEAGRQLLADSYEQLGYQSESAPWRDNYLTATQELRQGKASSAIDIKLMEGVLRHTPVSNFFQSMAVRLKAEEAMEKDYRIGIHFKDLDERYLLYIENAVLHYQTMSENQPLDAELIVTKDMFLGLIIGKYGASEIIFSDDIQFAGSKLDLLGFFSLFDKPEGKFNIVTP